MRRAIWTLIILNSLIAQSVPVTYAQTLATQSSSTEAKLLALQQEREQLLATVG